MATTGSGAGAGEPGPEAPRPRRPLEGLRVLELGQILAGPLAGSILGYFGADVIKVEPPEHGDPIRTWRVLADDGTSYWWRSLGRNKRSVALDLRQPRGQEIARRLAAASDVLLENFRPGTLERWGLGPDILRAENPDLVVTRISGFGQTGPYRDRRGFASVCEAFGGLRHVTGHPGEVPVRSNLSLGDTLAAYQAVIGTLLGLVARARIGGPGETVDVAIYEAVFGVLEGALTEYVAKGVVRAPSGTTITGVVPTDAYPCADGRHVVVGANGDAIYRRLMRAAGRDDLADDPRLRANDGRVAHQREIDEAIATWTRTLPAADVLARLEAAGVPAGPINTIADLAADPHFRARGMGEAVSDDGGSLELPALGPRLARHPGASDWVGPALGAHTADVLAELAGIGPAELEALRADGICA